VYLFPPLISLLFRKVRKSGDFLFSRHSFTFPPLISPRREKPPIFVCLFVRSFAEYAKLAGWDITSNRQDFFMFL